MIPAQLLPTAQVACYHPVQDYREHRWCLGEIMQDKSIEVAVVLRDEDLNDSKLNSLAREMIANFNRQRGIEARVPDTGPSPGSKGDPVAVGTIVLQLLGSGGAIAVLLNGLKAYFLRKQSLVIDVKRKDGATFKLHADNLSDRHLETTVTQLSDFLKG